MKKQAKIDQYIKIKRGSKQPLYKTIDLTTQQPEVTLQVFSHDSKTFQRRMRSNPEILIAPANLIFFESIIKPKMLDLFTNYSPEAVRNFIKHNLTFSRIQNIDNLAKIEMGTMFWNVTLSELLSLLLESADLISSQIRFLVRDLNSIVQLTRKQILLILGSMFFGIMPPQFNENVSNFGLLMQISKNDTASTNKMKIQKLKCIATYFNCMMEVKQKNPFILEEKVQFRRICSINLFNVYSKVRPMKDAVIQTIDTGKIEDHYGQRVMVDFANKKIGGGILNKGCVQEQIMFSIFPELIVTTILCCQLQDNEAIIARGARKFSYYSGYSETFTFESSCFDDFLHVDHEKSVIVAIDACDFRKKERFKENQYSKKGVRRQLGKAFTGFKGTTLYTDQTMPVCTGRWGCGAFGGDQDIKFLIQWIACSLVNRNMVYITASKNQQIEYSCLYRQFKDMTTSDILGVLDDYVGIWQNSKRNKPSLLTYIKNEVIL